MNFADQTPNRIILIIIFCWLIKILQTLY